MCVCLCLVLIGIDSYQMRKPIRPNQVLAGKDFRKLMEAVCYFLIFFAWMVLYSYVGSHSLWHLSKRFRIDGATRCHIIVDDFVPVWYILCVCACVLCSVNRLFAGLIAARGLCSEAYAKMSHLKAFKLAVFPEGPSWDWFLRGSTMIY